MNKQSTAVMFLLLLLSMRVSAQEEHWDTYMAKYGNKPGSVLVNMALMPKAPDKKFPYLVITGPRAKNCNKQGIPSNDDIDELEEILDAGTNFITGVTARVLVGTFTYKCERLNYYYVKDTAGVRDALGRMYARSYGSYEYSIKIKHDPEWIAYRTFLYPDSSALRWMNYSQLIAGMMTHGDSLTKSRDINFETYFRSDSDRKAFSDFAKSKSYKVNMEVKSQSTSAPFELIVSKNGMVRMDIILANEDELIEQIKKHRGYYNGWSAPLNNVLKK